jgi:hypothetical protein
MLEPTLCVMSWLFYTRFLLQSCLLCYHAVPVWGVVPLADGNHYT